MVADWPVNAPFHMWGCVLCAPMLQQILLAVETAQCLTPVHEEHFTWDPAPTVMLSILQLANDEPCPLHSCQRAHRHRAVHAPVQVRRLHDGDPERARFPPDQRPGRPRKGFYERGWVVAQAPEHVIENMEQKRPREGRKVTKRRPPVKNFVNWDKGTFERRVAAPPERWVSHFQVSHGMLLNVLSRDGDGCGAMRALIARSHEPAGRRQARRASMQTRSQTGRRRR